MEETAYDLFRRGSDLLAEGHARQAVEALAEARALEPEKASICEALGRAYFVLGRVRDAAAQFEAAAAIDPTNDYAHFGLALCLERQGRYAEARGHARMAVTMRPGNEDYRRAASRLQHLPPQEAL